MAQRTSVYRKSTVNGDDMRLSRGEQKVQKTVQIVEDSDKLRQNQINDILQNYGSKTYEQVQREQQLNFDLLNLYPNNINYSNTGYNYYTTGPNYVDQVLQQSRLSRLQAEHKLNNQDEVFEVVESQKKTGNRNSLSANVQQLNRSSQVQKEDIVRNIIQNTEYEPIFYQRPAQVIPVVRTSISQDRYLDVIASYERQIRELNDQLKDWSVQLNLKDKQISELQSEIQKIDLVARDRDIIIQQLREEIHKKDQVIAQLQYQLQQSNQVDHNLYKSQIDQRDQKINELREENNQLLLRNESLQSSYNKIAADFKTLQDNYQRLNVKGAWCC